MALPHHHNTSFSTAEQPATGGPAGWTSTLSGQDCCSKEWGTARCANRSEPLEQCFSNRPTLGHPHNKLHHNAPCPQLLLCLQTAPAKDEEQRWNGPGVLHYSSHLHPPCDGCPY
jgi:hypothetical protein